MALIEAVRAIADEAKDELEFVRRIWPLLTPEILRAAFATELYREPTLEERVRRMSPAERDAMRRMLDAG